MAEEPPVAAAPAKVPKKKATKAKNPGPSVGDLITGIVTSSTDRTGVSLFNIKKQLAANSYDVDKNKNRVLTTIKRLVENGTLTQVRGSGASGSFKLNKKAEVKKVKKPALKKTPVAAPKPKPKPKAKAKVPAKKAAATPKKTKATAKKPAAKKAAAKKVSKPAASPKKKAAKSPQKKAVKKATPKKASTKKVASKKVAKPKPAKKTAPKKK